MSDYTERGDPKQGRMNAEYIAEMFDYDYSWQLFEDLVDFYRENGEFTAREFVDEYGIEPEGDPEGALSALRNIAHFDMSAALEGNGEKVYRLEGHESK